MHNRKSLAKVKFLFYRYARKAHKIQQREHGQHCHQLDTELKKRYASIARRQLINFMNNSNEVCQEALIKTSMTFRLSWYSKQADVSVSRAILVFVFKEGFYSREDSIHNTKAVCFCSFSVITACCSTIVTEKNNR